MARILVLGGTTEASSLARALAEAKMDAVFSYAGRTNSPIEQPLPTRIGGFGGADGLAAYLRTENITHVVDATHPFAAQMSRNAVSACAQAGVPLIGFERPPWQAADADNWHHVADMAGAVAALPEPATRVFLAIGKQNLEVFAVAPQHHYLVRLVDQPQVALPLPHTTVEIARGPFDTAGDTALMRRHHIQWIVAKNAGGSGARAKLDAARALDLPVILIDRPALPPRSVVGTLPEVMDRLGHPTRRGV